MINFTGEKEGRAEKYEEEEEEDLEEKIEERLNFEKELFLFFFRHEQQNAEDDVEEFDVFDLLF